MFFEPKTLSSSITLHLPKVNLSTKEISEANNPNNFGDHIKNAIDGGTIAKNARIELEQKTGNAVVSPLNAKDTIIYLEDSGN